MHRTNVNRSFCAPTSAGGAIEDGTEETVVFQDLEETPRLFMQDHDVDIRVVETEVLPSPAKRKESFHLTSFQAKDTSTRHRQWLSKSQMDFEDEEVEEKKSYKFSIIVDFIS